MTARRNAGESRPWGEYVVLADARVAAAPAAVKILTVEAGQATSLQTHDLRWEEWTPLEDGAFATLGDVQIALEAGHTYEIAQGMAHRIHNPTGHRVRIVEVMFGKYRETDIVRLDDNYGRSDGK